MVCWPLINHKHRFICFWIPKCACTTIKHWFLDTLGIKVKGDIHKQIGYLDGEYFVSKEDIEKKYSDYYKFIVVRNPYDRLVSYYTSKILNGINLFLNTNIANCSFKDLVEIVLKTKNKDLEHHLQPQFCGLEGIFFDKIVKVENLEDDLKEVCQHLDIPFTGIKKHNKTEKGKVNELVMNWIPSNFKRKGIPDYELFYDENLKRRVRTKFIEDFVLFGYLN
jgi:hypothetical protein